MAPDIVKREKYEGSLVDVFSLGVTLFTIVNGIFPFTGSQDSDQFYQHLAKKDFVSYWQTIDINSNTKEFKDLF